MALFTRNSVLACAATMVALVSSASQEANACTPTGYVRDSIDLTAALINPHGNVSGDVDATGCNIGIYYSPGAHGRVIHANVHGANYYGIVNNGAYVSIWSSTISDIGETPFNGSQHGIGIYFVSGSAARGWIQGNTVWNYQKGGIAIAGPYAKAFILHNTVVGLGPVPFIAQNGIQAGYGADAKILGNLVSGNSYTGSSTYSAGILLVGGSCYFDEAPQTNTDVQQNTVVNNDVGIAFSNLGGVYPNCPGPVTTPTRNTAIGNKSVNNAINNGIYQAGISVAGSHDTIKHNYVCGTGYPDPATTTPPYLYAIDVDWALNAKVKHNTVCPSTSSSSSAFASALTALPIQATHPASPVK